MNKRLRIKRICVLFLLPRNIRITRMIDFKTLTLSRIRRSCMHKYKLRENLIIFKHNNHLTDYWRECWHRRWRHNEAYFRGSKRGDDLRLDIRDWHHHPQIRHKRLTQSSTRSNGGGNTSWSTSVPQSLIWVDHKLSISLFLIKRGNCL